MSSIQAGINAIAQQEANRPVVKRFFRFAAAVAFVPIAVYFIVFEVYRSFNNAGSGLLAPPIVAGIAAVFALNIVTALFALVAYKEASPPPPPTFDSGEDSAEEEHENISESEIRGRPKTE